MPVQRKDDTYKDIPISKTQAAQEVSFEEQTNLLLNFMIQLLSRFFDNNGKHRELLELTPMASQYTSSNPPKPTQRLVNIYMGRRIADRELPAIMVDIGSYKPKRDLGIGFEQPDDLIKQGVFLHRFNADIDVIWRIATHSEQSTNNLSFIISQILTIYIPFVYHGILTSDTGHFQIIAPMQVESDGDLADLDERDSVRDKLFYYTYSFPVKMESILYRKTTTNIAKLAGGYDAAILDPTALMDIVFPSTIRVGETVDIFVKAYSENPSLFCKDSTVLKLVRISAYSYLGRALRPGNAELILDDRDNRIKKTATVSF